MWKFYEPSRGASVTDGLDQLNYRTPDIRRFNLENAFMSASPSAPYLMVKMSEECAIRLAHVDAALFLLGVVCFDECKGILFAAMPRRAEICALRLRVDDWLQKLPLTCLTAGHIPLSPNTEQ